MEELGQLWDLGVVQRASQEPAAGVGSREVSRILTHGGGMSKNIKVAFVPIPRCLG